MTVAERILELARERPNVALTPAEICVRLEINEATAYTTLKRMRAKGQLMKSGYGSYHLPGAKPMLRPSRKLMWSRLLDLEERVAQLEAKAP
jgi:DNA-binding IclR family transcriptional regulator